MSIRKTIQGVHLADIHTNTTIADGRWFITRNGRNLNLVPFQCGLTYRVNEPRLMFIVSGQAEIFINLMPVKLHPQMLLFIAPGTIFEIEHRDDKFDFLAFSFLDMPRSLLFSSCREILLTPNIMQIVRSYFDLLWLEATQQVPLAENIQHLQIALMHRLRNAEDCIHSLHYTDPRLDRFIELVEENALQHRDIAFYADKLCVTPNHLGFMVKKMSGSTVLEWINRNILQQAKVELLFSDAPVAEIAYKLQFSTPSFFVKFFKRETGMTPGKYRAQEPVNNEQYNAL